MKLVGIKCSFSLHFADDFHDFHDDPCFLRVEMNANCYLPLVA